MSNEMKKVKSLLKKVEKRKELNEKDYKMEARDDLHEKMIKDLEEGMRLGGDCKTASLTLEKLDQFKPLDGSIQQVSSSELKQEEFNTAFKSFLENEVMADVEKETLRKEKEQDFELEKDVEKEVEEEWFKEIEKKEVKVEERQV